MGVVYLARGPPPATAASRSSRCRSALAGNTELRERLQREARAAATITHPAVAIVYALEEVEGHLLLASEFLDGRTLRTVIDEGPMDAATVHAHRAAGGAGPAAPRTRPASSIAT